jgi:hypothetical protein
MKANSLPSTGHNLPVPAGVSRGGGPLILWLPVLLLAAYVLATGPLLRLSHATGFPRLDALETFYAPLAWCVKHCAPLGNFLGWYVFDLWGNTLPF